MLYIVATPIGNLEDITLRALRVLKEVDIIAAEDTRRTIKLLNHYDIKTKLISFHEYSDKGRREWIIGELLEGKNVALVSDAGTPLISDPGAILVTDAAKRGIEITSLPGACAAITALSLSGMEGGFVFVGFLSKKASDRKEQIISIEKSGVPSVIYESPHKLGKTLGDFLEAFGQDRKIIVAKELTKLYERVFRGSILDACSAFENSQKGEFVLIVGAREKKDEVGDEEINLLINKYIEGGMTKKDAAKATSKKLGISKNRTYRLTI